MTYFGGELAFEVDPDDLVRDLEAGHTDGYVVVETRAPEAFDGSHPRRHQPPLPDLDGRDRTGHLDKNLVYVCYCESTNCNAGHEGRAQARGTRLQGETALRRHHQLDRRRLPGRTAAADRAGIRCACCHLPWKA